MPHTPLASSLPLLYSFRRCPYAIRARLALELLKVSVEIIEVSLREKPERLWALNPQGTVPVLVLPDGQVFIESLDIMRWACKLTPHELAPESDESRKLIAQNDTDFKYWLDRYKYADRYPEQDALYYREHVLQWFIQLDEQLKKTTFLFSDRPNLSDLALIPFVRQAAAVDLVWFDSLPLKSLQRWRLLWLSDPVFQQVMAKARKNCE